MADGLTAAWAHYLWRLGRGRAGSPPPEVKVKAWPCGLTIARAGDATAMRIEPAGRGRHGAGVPGQGRHRRGAG